MRSNEITMSTTDMNKVENEEENKTPDKKQIEAEEKEVMLKVEDEGKEVTEVKVEGEGPVKAALACAVTEQGREVKPKFIPIGAIKMPGFFTRNSDKEKKEDDGIEKDGEEKDENKPKRHRLQFLHTCPFTQFLHHPRNATTEEQDGGNNAGNAPGLKERLANLNLPNIKYPKMFQKRSTKDAEATLASMETLEDKLDTPNDGMENVKLEVAEEEGKVATKLPLKERIRQKKFIMDDIVVAAVVLLVLVAVIVGVAVGARAGPPAERPLRLGRYITTITSCGEVEGILDEGVYKFYSIPYAPPPVGERRFAYTQPLNNLSMCWNGTLQVHNRGPLCIQFLENGTITGDEDCLTLDIVTPHVRYDSPLPVVVLIGTNTLAGGISPAQPSALYARTKEVVFVRPNFRLGPFGFLALDILSTTKYPATSGNYALTDLLTTLDWVNKNIKHFGGDPNSVTLLGHRAGATLTAALTTIKKAQPLFSRAWLSSPSVVFEAQPLEKAEKENEQVKQLTKCQDVQCLRRISATEILTAIPEAWLSDNSVTLPTANENRHSWLVLDGDLLRMQINESWAEQKKIKEEMGKNVFKPMIMGTTQHSGHSQALRMKHLNWTSELVEQMVNNSAIGEKLGAEVYTQFNKTYEGLTELIAALRTLCPLHRASQSALGVPLYVVLGAGAGGGAGGARLAPVDADVQAILGTFDSDMPEQRRFMAAMQQLFYYYVWHGNLAGPETALIAVGQDLLPLPDLPACRFLAEKGLVPNYAHVD